MVGTWNATAPDGAQSVKDNEVILQNNTTYIEQNLELDHFWAEDATNDGHHKFVKCPKFESAPGVPDNPSPSGIDSIYYAKQKTAAESASELVIPHFSDNAATPNISELMGIRSCGLVSIDATPGFAITERYKHNLTSITRGGVGVYNVVFPALPSQYYLAYVMALRRGVAGESARATINGTTKTATGFQILVQRAEVVNTKTDPSELWFFVFGG
jgi:hypothetical protein